MTYMKNSPSPSWWSYQLFIISDNHKKIERNNIVTVTVTVTVTVMVSTRHCGIVGQAWHGEIAREENGSMAALKINLDKSLDVYCVSFGV